MRALFFTVLGNLYLIAGTVVLGLLASVVGWLPPRGNWMYLCARVWATGLLWASGVRLEVLGAGRRGRVVYMANHQSLFDIPVLLAAIPEQTRFMAKESLFRIPVFGWALRAGGFVPVDRKDRSQARQAFAAAGARLAGGVSLLLFPESTRTDGTALLPFQRGGFLIALKAGLPIVPVGIRGTAAIQRKGSLLIRAAPARVAFGGPIDPTGYGVRRLDELIAEVRGAVERLAEGPDSGRAGDAAGSDA